MSPLGEAGKEAIKTNASRKSCNQRTKRKKIKLVVEHLLCGSLLLFPSFTLFPSLPVYVCM